MATISIAGLNRIGDGPVATVYEGLHAGRPVALKVLPKRLDKRTFSTYQKEQARLAQLRRVPSILLVEAIDELDSGEPVLRMERCTQSLAGLVERIGPLAAKDVVVLAASVTAALAAAHGAGVVHGGMSPHNVLFRPSVGPVLADFGVTLREAFARDPLHAIEFLPPETLRTGELNPSTDLYGLGAVLHFALTGRSPHPGRLGEQPGERVLRILGEPVPAINAPDVPLELSTLVARLLATDPARRPHDTGAVANQLAAMLPDQPPRQATDDFDDFDAPTAPAPAPPPHPTAPARQEPYLPDDDLDDLDDFDDFAGPPAHAATFHPAPRPLAQRPPAYPLVRPVYPVPQPAAPRPPVLPAPQTPPHPAAGQPRPPATAPPAQPPVAPPTAPHQPAPPAAPTPPAMPPSPPVPAPPPADVEAASEPSIGPPLAAPGRSAAPLPADVVREPGPAPLASSGGLHLPPAPPVVESALAPPAAPAPAPADVAAASESSIGPLPAAADRSAAPLPADAVQEPEPAPLASSGGRHLPPTPTVVESVLAPVPVQPTPPAAPVSTGGLHESPVPPVIPSAPAPVQSTPSDAATPVSTGGVHESPVSPAPVTSASSAVPVDGASAPLASGGGLQLPPGSPVVESAPAPVQSTPSDAATPVSTGGVHESHVSQAPVESASSAVPADGASAPLASGGGLHLPPASLVAESSVGQAFAVPVEEAPVDFPRERRGLGDPPAATDIVGPASSDDSGEFGDFAPAEPERATSMLFPPPAEEPRRRVRYDLLAGAGLILALLALVPLLLLRNEPEELDATAQVPPAGAPQGDVRVELSRPNDLTDRVELTWHSTVDELDFAVVVAAEGEETKVLLAERNLSMTVDVEPGRKYCFLIQATDGEEVYESDPVPLRGATCRK